MDSNVTSAWNLKESINKLCRLNKSAVGPLQSYLPKQIWSKHDREEILLSLARLFKSGESVVDVASLFQPVILEIASRARDLVVNNGKAEKRNLQKFAFVLSKTIALNSELMSFTVKYLREQKPFESIESEVREPVKKKAKQQIRISELEWCCGMWTFLTHLPEVCDCLSITSLLDHLAHKDASVRWYAASGICKYIGMPEAEKDTFMLKIFKDAELKAVTIKVDKDYQKILARHQELRTSLTLEAQQGSQAHTLQAVSSHDLSPSVVSITGILLNKLDTGQNDSDKNAGDLVPVASTLHHLRSLALAVSAGKPVLLQGPVGCGKTTLVEYLAYLTGRRGVPHLIKIQLGDQTDSKTLLGTYCSTETPGEFVWRAGALTHAVTSGSWVLLEDVDQAPMEVISLLVALVETGGLPLQGHGGHVRASPGFQLFVTQRLLSSAEGFHRQLGSKSNLLDKLCCVVNVEPLCRSELEQVITNKYPALRPIRDKLLDIYFMLSSGEHESDGSGRSADKKFVSHGGRLISTRDLMTWCGRSSVDFDHRESSQGLKVFLEALDCFVSCLPKPSVRLMVASALGEKLNVTEDRARYFCSQHKPSIKETQKSLEIGRSKLKIDTRHMELSVKQAPTFSYTRPALVLLERVAVCVQRMEPVLLTGETGTGKTSTVQFLAHHLCHRLHVINLNQQSDSTDFLGGFKPVDFKLILMPVREEFETLFCQSFSRDQNIKFLSHVQTLFSKKQWPNLITLMEAPISKAVAKFEEGSLEYLQWSGLQKRLYVLRQQMKDASSTLAFSFIEGTLVKAMQRGEWVLLDEINLASAETLDSLAGLLESPTGSVVLAERGDMEPVKRHPDFRLFACMNPATDVGKKDLPSGIRNRFTEFYVDELENSDDLSTLVRDYLQGLSLSPKQVAGIVKFYLTIRGDVAEKLTDGTGHRPHYSLRTLCVALRYSGRNPCKSVPRSLYEGFCLSFLSQLDRVSHPIVEALVCKHILGSTTSTATKAILSQKLPRPVGQENSVINVADYWLSCGGLKPTTNQEYIVTPSVKLNLRDLARVVAAGRQPVLLQGETSVGKTSLVVYLAKLTGNECVRVNNHEHTDLQEYIGSYVADDKGKLVFKEGVLVEAMRKGHWIILDELNLAPTDVLEALNRLLDCNQELFIAETQEVVQAHPKFQLFATQNPPGLYGGRKVLSRAFRNRFIELHFDEIPPKELETILHMRCGIPLSYAKKLVAVMLELQTRRRGSSIFSGKQGFMTLRDLFRWAQRYNCLEAGQGKAFYDWDKHLADHGYMLIAGRVRKEEEETIILEVLEKHLKRKVSPDALFTICDETPAPFSKTLESVMSSQVEGFEHMVWTFNMRRLALLIGQCIRFEEPVLLVGSTGIGKTTVCQLYAAIRNQTLSTVNCHMHTESGDFLGGLRPVRAGQDDDDEPLKEQKLFEWRDGPLVSAMREGGMFLVDEISLADDSVLERLNSVLEPERTLVLAERGGLGDEGVLSEVEIIKAGEEFRLFATMNPGGDFGKKELSPALRNRFTEIWCPPAQDRKDLIAIVEKNIRQGLALYQTKDGSTGFGKAMVDFIDWFSKTDFGRKATVSIRDLLSWVNFINSCCGSDQVVPTDDQMGNSLDPKQAYVHGACLTFVDSLGAGTTQIWNTTVANASRKTCIQFLLTQLSSLTGRTMSREDCGLPAEGQGLSVVMTDSRLCIPPFAIERGVPSGPEKVQFSLDAPTPCVNGQRILRGLQLQRPILLEGSPGVGKTSLVAALAKLARRTLVRINLSEQTDVSDLFGADLPVEGEQGGKFAWRDGPFLQALRAGHWVVFDELNLASQSVLEGLNACLDHRAEVFVPELARTFHINKENTRIFACQNPLAQGGGRKGLPQSFLNRFTKVYVDALTRDDLIFIARNRFPKFDVDMLTAMVDFNTKMHQVTMVEKKWGSRGSPWEFNLRDLVRWCELMEEDKNFQPGQYVGLIYKDRMRTAMDKSRVEEAYTQALGSNFPLSQPSRVVCVGPSTLQAGVAFLPRASMLGQSPVEPLLKLHHCLEPLESLAKCVQMGWLSILVGPQSCGKTSLVRLLAQLCGQTLSVLPMNSAMDTTELLGGFEQSNPWRHLSEVSDMVEAELRQAERSCLQGAKVKDTNELRCLEEAWGMFKDVSVPENLSGRDEHETLILMLKTLQGVVDILDRVTKQAGLAKVKDALTQLTSTVTPLISGGRGGMFEWVDSSLVNAVRDGHWLLVDNVNFCSASVLDRLNALLEPDGVLSINERGTVDGQIPSIKPHENFRLFFAMDPRYGEISRAMRNRGIEIYILGEEDNCPFDQRDLANLLRGCGLEDSRVATWLLTTHHALQGSMGRGDRLTIVDLLQTAQSFSQLISRGVNSQEAMNHAMEDVYVSQRSSATIKKQVRAAVEECLQSLPEGKQRERTVTTLCRIVPGEASQLSQLKGQLSFLFNVLQEASVGANKVHQRTAGNICVSLLTASAHKLLEPWLEATWPRLQSTLASSTPEEERPDLERSLADVRVLITASAQHVFTSPAWEGLQTLVQDTFGSDASALSLVANSGWDLNHNPSALGHALRMSTTEHGDMEVEGGESVDAKIWAAVKRLQFVQKCSEISFLLRSRVQELEKVVAKGSKGIPTLGLVVLFLSEMASHLPSLVEHMDTMALAPETWPKLQWLLRLAQVGVVPGGHMTCDVITSHLALHWQWLEGKLGVLMGLAEGLPRVAMAIDELHRLGWSDDGLAKLYGKMLSTFGHPLPFFTQRQAELTSSLNKMVAKLCITEDWNQEQISCFHKVDMAVKRMLVDVANKISKDDEDAFEALDTLTNIMKAKGIIKSAPERTLREEEVAMDTDANEMASTATSPSSISVGQRVNLWPLFEHIATLVMLHQTASGLTTGTQPNKDQLHQYILTHTSLGLGQVARCSHHDQTGLQQLSEAHEMVWHSKASHNPQLWMNYPNADVPGGKEQLGPAFLHQPSLSRAAMSLLARGQLKAITELLPMDVHLGQLDQERVSLFGVSQHVWCHSSALSSSAFNVQQSEVQLLWFSFRKLLRLLHFHLPADKHDAWLNITSQMDNNLPLSVDSATWEDILHCISSVQSLAKLKTSVFTECIELTRKATHPGQRSECVGQALAHVGVALTHLLAPRGPVDPVEKAGLKLQHVIQELEEIQGQLSTWDHYVTLTFGRSLELTPVEHIHPEVTRLRTRKGQLEVSKVKLEQKIAFRPLPGQFKELTQSVQSFLDSSCSLARVTGLTNKLVKSMGPQQATKSTTNPALQEEGVWQDSAARFIKTLNQKYPLYRDLVTPVCLALNQIKYGLRLMAQQVDIESRSQKVGAVSFLRKLVRQLCQFPSITPSTCDLLTLATMLSKSSTQTSLAALIHSEIHENNQHSLDIVKSRLLMCALWLMRAHCATTTRLDTQLIQALFKVFDLFTKAWSGQEDKRRLKEAEKSALYRHKEETHGDERSDAERDEEEFKKAYPTYEKDFFDVTGAKRLEDVGLENEEDHEGEGLLEEVSAAEVEAACQIHHDVFTSLTSTHWLTPETEGIKGQGCQKLQCDLVSPALLGYQLGSDLVKRHYHLMDADLDSDILGCHLLTAGSVASYLDTAWDAQAEQSALTSPLTSLTPPGMVRSKGYNFYVDSNIQEVMKCRPVLENVRLRVEELQVDWPQHPVLIMVQDIISRILSFPVHCPVVKFLTGLELLLEKSQEWESNAASFVSLATLLAELTNVIVQWRKLELSCWNSALDTEEAKCKVKATQWWLHLYNLTSDFLKGHLDSQKQEPGVLERKRTSKVLILITPKEDVLTSLKKFMETSTVGEFSVRLKMLRACHCQMVHNEASDRQAHMASLLWNVYQFYMQYEESVVAQMKQLRVPIEKQLKGFVKIARWNDMNYWALKASTEKTHRTVHKYIKEYQAVLGQPVQNLLGDKGENLVAISVAQNSSFPLTEKMAAFTTTLMTQIDMVKDRKVPSADTLMIKEESFPLMSRLPRLLARLKTHVKRSVKGSPVMGMIVTFDELCGELIEEMHEVQQLEVDTTKEKEKQKSEAKSINLRKRKGLAELFKYLAQVGLSFRRGMIKGVKSAFVSALEASPLDLSASPDTAVSELWDGCQSYFYRCIARHTQFQAAMVKPSSELTMAEVERCVGFVEYFAQLYIAHQGRLAEATGHFMTLRKLVKALNELEERSLPPQTQAKKWMSNVHQLSTSIQQALAQFSLLLQACPATPPQLPSGQSMAHPSPLPSSQLAASSGWVKGDQEWQDCVSQVQDLSGKVKEQKGHLDKVMDQTLFGWSDVAVLKSALDCHRSLCVPLQAVCSHFVTNDQSDPDKPSSFVASLCYILKQINSTTDNFSKWLVDVGYESVLLTSQNSNSVDSNILRTLSNKQSELSLSASQQQQDVQSDEISNKFFTKTEKLVEQVLLSVQNVVQIEKDLVYTKSKTGGNPEEDEEFDLQDNHLTQHLLDRERSLVGQLRCPQNVSKIQEVISELHAVSDQQQHTSPCLTSCVGAVCRVVPLLNTYTAAVERQLGCSVSLHRAMGKLLSVLLAVFTELMQKGFCIPPEMSDEMDGEGATEFVDAEGGGIGEGEGAKDVSEQIESEDQLDEARPAGEQKKEEEDQKNIDAEDNAIEMSDDIEGKLHDLDPTDEKDEDNEDDKKEGDEEMDKQMGDADGDQEERLDERMWGSDEEDEDGDEEKKEENEDGGKGGMDEKEQELVAKDDNKGATEADPDDDRERQKDGEEDNQPNELMSEDEDYDDNKVNPHRPEDQEEVKDLDLEDDLQLEGEDGKDDKDDEDMGKDVEGEDNEDKADQSEDKEEESKEAEPEEGEGGVEEEGDKDKEAPADGPEEGLKEEEAEDLDNNKAEAKDEEGEEEKKEDGGADEKEDKPSAEIQRNESAEAREEQKGQDGEDAQEAGTEKNDDKEAAQGEVNEEREDDGEDKEGVGSAQAETEEGHQGQKSQQSSAASAQDKNTQSKRKPGKSDSNRTLGSQEKEHRRLKTIDQAKNQEDEGNDGEKDPEKMQTDGEFEHVKDSKDHWDAQTIDTATADQTKEKQAVPSQDEGEEVEENDDVKMEEEDENEETSEAADKKAKKSKDPKDQDKTEKEAGDGQEGEPIVVEGDKVLTYSVARAPDSTIHTVMEHLHLGTQVTEEDMSKLRAELEQCVSLWAHPEEEDQDMAAAAGEAWQQYLAVTGNLAQELCEQLRLILEPSQATQLKGDYRTGKRLNMRKVIPYIASQFRKDKIWLRRSKPSKRQYQIMIAMDDSSSMADSHTKQLAFETLALVSTSLTLLDAGQLAVCSFGEDVKMLHPFGDPLTSQAGGNILQQLTCDQKQTKYGMLLDRALALMTDARRRQGGALHSETAQLLLVLSDGRGVFREGMEFVRRAVRRARAGHVFLVFVIMENPDQKGSLLEAKVPLMDASGKVSEIKPYLELFPFPFYIILRDINCLPVVLSDALRQWFELVTASDR